VVDWLQQTFVSSERSAALWALTGFVVTFVVVRGITRRIRAKAAEPAAEGGGGLSDIYIGGVHVHHQVWGILLVLLCGLLEFRYQPDPPWVQVLATFFGIGAALTLDEFALWFHLDDVYWGEQGRQSVDAILIGGALGAVLLVQASPVGMEEGPGPGALAHWTYIATICVHLAMAGVCFLKGKIATGMIGIVLPLVATVGAVRLAKPASVWARRRYSGAKLARAGRRFGPAYLVRRHRLLDLIGGVPDPARPARREDESRP
jgi:hypothetical protein